MKEIMEFAKENNLLVLEDCAQSQGASINGIKAGNWGHAVFALPRKILELLQSMA